MLYYPASDAFIFKNVFLNMCGHSYTSGVSVEPGGIKCPGAGVKAIRSYLTWVLGIKIGSQRVDFNFRVIAPAHPPNF